MNPAALTGGTGYIGGRLLPQLEGCGVRLRCLTRRSGDIRPNVSAGTQIAQADVLAPRSLNDTLQDVDSAYYLIHSMGARGDFEQSDRRVAANFAAAVNENGVRRIICLGGLGDADGPTSIPPSCPDGLIGMNSISSTRFVFAGMLRGIAQAAETLESDRED